MNKLDSLYLSDFKTEHVIQPIGIETDRPRFSWKLNSDGKR